MLDRWRKRTPGGVPETLQQPLHRLTARRKSNAVWSHMKRSGVARSPLRRGEKLKQKIEAQLAKIKRMPQLVRSFFQAPSVAYIADG